MKKVNFSKLALLGMVGGLMSVGQPGIEAAQDSNSIDIQHLLATPGCKSHGCGTIAEREVPKTSQDDMADDSDNDSDDSDRDADESAKMDTTKVEAVPAKPVSGPATTIQPAN